MQSTNRNKKLLFITIAILLLIPTSTNWQKKLVKFFFDAQISTYSIYKFEQLSDSTVEITGIKNGFDPEEIDIPSKLLKGFHLYSVTSIGDFAFQDRFKSKSVIIPNSITHIGENPFLKCSNLAKIKVASENPYFISNDDVLYGIEKSEIISVLECKKGSFSIPPHVISINNYAFYQCAKLETLEIPNSVTYIGEHAFEGCSFERIDIPESVTYLGTRAFADCRNLREANIQGQMENIEEKTFEGCYNLKSVELSSHITHIGFNAFTNCKNLKHIHLKESSRLKIIDPSAFQNCIELHTSNLPLGW